MSHFSKSFLSFFKELSESNTTAWFDANRSTYEKEVKKPFAGFVGEMIERIAAHEPGIAIKPSDAIMRINKDIRFSKDKTPYNTHMAANISRFGKKDKSYPGFYFQLSPANVSVFGGAYVLDPAQLQQVRQYIARNLKEFAAAYSDKGFKNTYGQLQGAQQKRLPEEFKEVQTQEPLIANKQYYFTAEMPASLITSAGLADRLMEHYLAAKTVNEFLRRALNN